MKRLFFAFACAALIITACSKPENDSNTTKLSVPEAKQYHACLILDDNNLRAELDRGDIPSLIELTTGGEFVLGFKKPENTELQLVSGTYTVLDTKAQARRFDFGKYGILSIEDRTGTSWPIVYSINGKDYTTEATPANDVITGTFADNVCRRWAPKSLIVAASGDGLDSSLGLGKRFDDISIYKLAHFLIDNGVDVSTEDLAPYDIDSISFTESGKIIINFKNYAVSPFAGKYTLSDKKENNLSYEFELSYKDNPVLPISGIGTLSVNRDKLSIFIEDDFSYDEGSTYHISLTIICQEYK